MKITTSTIEGVYVIEPNVFGDDRGYFMESYSKSLLTELGIDNDFVQDNESFSTQGVLRGLHYQCGECAQAKLVRVIQGEVLDVIVDVRPDSKTYGEHFGIRLSGENKMQMLVPRGMAHGYIVLSDTAIFAYKCDNEYNKASEGGLLFNDPKLKIDWILDPSSFLVSEKDIVLPVFGEHKPINL
ncbi:dTDP-4-dehydrorhamnose 3,5-epimerase [Saprospiraceae bacterium]|nr:dTDP-4-dehydrorhamnose 3,5-epimerase [Saprospiraceae bacterium]MDB4163043.1 dTDP-4-dehydrorhamnose 3,5-epimerase [Saprospiraceae bacterium]MDC1305336.1 dTDP-4-dehydrorhamnose 3,5-epimerase [Saprospiraceae bacterium]